MSQDAAPAGPGTGLIPRVQAEALARELRDRGLTATVVRARGHRDHPCVQVSQAGQGTEWVYAAPDDGHWWFVWSSLEVIAPLAAVGYAAGRIAGAIARGRCAAQPEAVWA